jgi:transcriptional regulator with XRE-family HTH domain
MKITMRDPLCCYKVSNYPGSRSTTRGELSEFLKSRRARISPATVGLPNGRRRRTPGLRREEVADLAGVGLTWYTWLEQGRDIRVSSEVLAAVARALRLEPPERGHLFRLAGHAPPPAEPADASIPPRLRRVLDAWDPFPAHLAGRRRDLLAWNRASEAINRWSQLPEDRRNLLWFMFMVPLARHLLVEWEKEAPLSVAALRAEAGRDLGEPDYRELVTELLERSPEFAAIWARQDVRGRLEGLKRFRHPEVGRFDLEFTSFQVAEQPSLRLYLYAPADDGRSEAKLREILLADSIAKQ